MFFVWIGFAVLVTIIAIARGRNPWIWALYAFLLWPVALVHVLVTPGDVTKVEARKIEKNENRKCTFCAELIRPEAKVCRYCHRDLPELPVPPPPPPARDPISSLTDDFLGGLSNLSEVSEMVAALRAANAHVDIYESAIRVKVGRFESAFHSFRTFQSSYPMLVSKAQEIASSMAG